MGNFFLDNKDLQFHLNHPLMKKIVELREKNFADKDVYDYAPADFEDAMDSYRRVLEITGGICADVVRRPTSMPSARPDWAASICPGNTRGSTCRLSAS